METETPLVAPPTSSSAAVIPGTATAPKGRQGFTPSNYLIVLLFVGPALALVTLLVIYPAIGTIYNSLTSTVGIGFNAPTTFVGLDNYNQMFTDPTLKGAI